MERSPREMHQQRIKIGSFHRKLRVESASNPRETCDDTPDVAETVEITDHELMTEFPFSISSAVGSSISAYYTRKE